MKTRPSDVTSEGDSRRFASSAKIAGHLTVGSLYT